MSGKTRAIKAPSVLRLAVMGMLLCIMSCGGLKGEFGFKTFNDDVYRKKADPLEFSINDVIRWVYLFPNRGGNHPIGIIYMKKELVWVEVETTVENISKLNRQVYGTIKKLPVGEYKLLLVQADDENRLIDERYFSIYSDDSEIDQD